MRSLRLAFAVLSLMCVPGLVSAQSTAPNADRAPFSGANSFTEKQARERIEKAGFAGVKNLKQDDQGVWRGHAQKSGQQVGVALDYRGNVVQQ
jgi:putative membrane protein